MSRDRYILVLIGALVMLGFSARPALSRDSHLASRRNGKEKRLLQRKREGLNRSNRDDERHGRRLGSDLQRGGRRHQRKTSYLSSRRSRYYISFGYGYPYRYRYRDQYGLYDYPVRRRETKVYMYVLPSRSRYREGEYERPVPKRQDEPKETLSSSELSSKLGGSDKVGRQFALGEEALKTGMFGLAIQDFRLAVLDDPDDPVPVLALGLALLARGDFEDAAAALRAGLSVHPDPEGIELDPQLMFGGKDAYALRVSEVVAGLEEDSENAALHLLMGFHHFAGGNWAEAVEHLQKAEALDGSDAASARLCALSMRHILGEKKGGNRYCG